MSILSLIIVPQSSCKAFGVGTLFRNQQHCYKSEAATLSSLKMSSNSNNNNADNDDKWSKTADLYSNQASRLTELHGADLVTILKNDILKAKTILDIGGGTGAFAKAYIQQFPNGIPGQTLITTDLSPSMLEKAKQSINVGSEFNTELIFQEEDGTKLDGIPDSSIDIVVSLFGVFLIPDQDATLTAIQRVLKKKNSNDSGIFANGSWMFNISDYFSTKGFGVSLQDAFQVPILSINPDFDMKSVSYVKWSTREGVESILANKCTSLYQYNSIHNTVWEIEQLWEMMVKNPMIGIDNDTKPEVIAKAKGDLAKFVSNGDVTILDRPLMLSTASILSVARGFGK